MVVPAVAMAEAKRPTLKVNESVVISGTPEAVWNVVKDWDGLHKWHPGFANAEITSGANGKAGAHRILTLKDGGGKFEEELLAFSDKKMTYKYRIVGEAPLPLTDYVSSIRVAKGKQAGTSVITWKGSFRRKVADNPPAGQDDKGVRELIVGVYQGGLGNVKNMVEGK
jgi:mxaD protein